jgi:cell wall-associated NlpC family hydrolase
LGSGGTVKFDTSSSYDKPYDDRTRRLRQEMDSWLGVRYDYGGTSRSGIDCSGYVMTVYGTLGVRLPRHSQTMANYGKPVTSVLRFGDVIVLRYPNRHVAMYYGDGKLIEATPSEVQVTRNLGRAYKQGIVRRFLY